MPSRQGERQLRFVQPLPSRQAEKPVRGVQPLPSWQAVGQLYGMHPMPSRQAETGLHSVQPLPPRHGETPLRSMQSLPSREAEKRLRELQPLPSRQAEKRLLGVQWLPPRQAKECHECCEGWAVSEIGVGLTLQKDKKCFLSSSHSCFQPPTTPPPLFPLKYPPPLKIVPHVPLILEIRVEGPVVFPDLAVYLFFPEVEPQT